MAPPNVAWLSSQHTVVWGKMEKVERISRYVAPPWVTSLLKSILFVLCPLLVKVMFPSNVSVLLTFAEIAPPCIAELLLKLLVPVKLNEIGCCEDCTTITLCRIAIEDVSSIEVKHNIF